MKLLFTILFIVSGTIIAILLARIFGIGGRRKLPYSKKNYLLSKAESSFFRVLEQAIENKYYIFPQVHLSDLLHVKIKNKGEYYKYLNKIDRKSVDFVIVEKNYLNPLLAIELDDSSHNYESRKERDNFVENTFKDAGLPLLRINCAVSYDVQKIKTRIEEILLGEKEIGTTHQIGSNIVP